jgi:hypothetical protein
MWRTSQPRMRLRGLSLEPNRMIWLGKATPGELPWELSVAAIYLLERLGSAGPEDDQRIREALANGLAEQVYRAKRQA